MNLVKDNDKTFAGTHDFIRQNGRFDVVHVSGEGWYSYPLEHKHETKGPFPTAEGAYLAAIDD